MIETIDSSLFPAFLRDTLLPSGFTDNMILWSQPDMSLLDRGDQVESLKADGTDIPVFPYCSYARSDAVSLIFDGSNVPLHIGVNYVGETDQLKSIEADRAEYVYTCIFRSRRQDEMVRFEKKFLRTMKYAQQLYTTISGTDIELGYEFIRDDFDSKGMYRNEDYLEQGKLYTALFDIKVRCWLFEDSDVAHNIQTIKFNLYGYSQDTDPGEGGLEENTVIT